MLLCASEMMPHSECSCYSISHESLLQSKPDNGVCKIQHTSRDSTHSQVSRKWLNILRRQSRHDACSKYFVVTALGDGRLIYKVSVLPFVTSQAFRTLGTNNGDQRVADSRVCRRTQRMLRASSCAIQQWAQSKREVRQLKCVQPKINFINSRLGMGLRL